MMVLYSGATCPFSHRCRFVLHEKSGDFEVIDVDPSNPPAEITKLNPYGELPILMEKRDADEKRKMIARAQIREQLIQLSPILSKHKYLMGDEFTMLDITLAPLLWRLGLYGIDLPSSAAPLLKYAETVFARNSFIDSMTPSEKVMRR